MAKFDVKSDVSRSVFASKNSFAALQSPSPSERVTSRRTKRKRRHVGPKRATGTVEANVQQQSLKPRRRITCDMLRMYVRTKRVKLAHNLSEKSERLSAFWRRWKTTMRTGISTILCKRRSSPSSLPSLPLNNPLPARVQVLERKLDLVLQRLDILEKATRKETAAEDASAKNVDYSSQEAAEENKDKSEPRIVHVGDRAYQKYERMVKIGVPHSAVLIEIIKDGKDPRVMFPDAPSDAPVAVKKTSISSTLLQGVQLRRRGNNQSEGSEDLETPKSKKSVISKQDLEKVKLRPTPQKISVRRAGNTPGAVISVHQLKAVQLRKASESSGNVEQEQSSAPKEKNATSSQPAAKAHPLLKNIGKVKLKKTLVDRSPGGTPRKQAGKRGRDSLLEEDKSPSQAKTDAEFLELALRRKFSRVHASMSSPAMQSPAAHSTGTSEAWSTGKPRRTK